MNKATKKAPMEPLDGNVMDGFDGLGDGPGGARSFEAGPNAAKLMVGSSCIMAISRPAQPS